MDNSHNGSQHGRETDSTNNVSHFFSREVQDKIAQHPCYSKQAHQYARMHLPVAPACNIQCNYCNRKYDCSNESRPGVVSRLVDTPLAIKQFVAIKKRAPNLKVVGIAGPGDALANPKATFATLHQLKAIDADVQLCISTNGLMLEPYVDDLVTAGVNHLTITINCIDPVIGQKIYPWVYFNHQRLRGMEAAQTLIARQLAGLEKAAKAGILVKVNTVLIPGINDHHIGEVSREVKRRGALLHNIMPLISDPAHGTYFGLTGQREPTEDELEAARTLSGTHMPQMTHCKQCRADAVGTLGGCSSQEESHSDGAAPTRTHPFRVAVASDGGPVIRIHFGHAKLFEIYEYSAENKRFHFMESRSIDQYCQGPECDDDDEKDKLLHAIADCDMVLCARIGIAPWKKLETLNVVPNVDFAFQPTDVALAQIAVNLSAKPHDSRQQAKGSAYEICHH